MTTIEPGLIGQVETTVTKKLLAPAMGSGTVDVYATPAMIALMEAAAVAAIAPHLNDDQTSVGVALEVQHLAATPPGQRVRARAEVTASQGRQVTFAVQVWDEHELVGRGSHTRVIIETARFMESVSAKAL